MAVVLEEALKRNLSEKRLLPVYVLFGEDSYLKSNYLNRIIRAAVDPEDVFNYSRFTPGCDLQEVYDAVMQLPVMAEKRCVVLNDYDFLHCDKADTERLLRLIAEVPQETVLILYFDAVPTDEKRDAKFKKILSACEKVGGMAVLLNHRRRAELVKILCDGAAKRGCRLNTSVADYLVENAGEDLNLLRNELDKLCFYIGSGEISKTHVDTVCTVTVEANLFRLSDKILEGRSTEALTMLDDLFFMHTEPMSMLYTIASVYTDMYRVSAARAAGLSPRDVAKMFPYKGKEFLLEKADRNLKKFSPKQLTLCLETVCTTDKRLKSYACDARTALEELIVKLIYIGAEGEALD